MDVIVHSVTGAFTTETGFFDAAERRFSCRDEAFVDAHHSRFETFGHSPHLGVIVAVEIVGQPPSRAVGDGHSLVLGVESVQNISTNEIGLKRRQFEIIQILLVEGANGSEDFFAVDFHVLGDVGEHRRLIEATLQSRMNSAARDKTSSFAHGVSDDPVDFLELLLVNEWPLIDGGVEPVARDQLILDSCGQHLGELVKNRFVDKYTVGGHASLASVSEFGSHDTLNSSR